MAASTDNGMNFARGAAKTTMARRVRAWIIPDTGVFAPERMLVAVLAIAPVAGSPPKSGERIFAIPCPTSSTFGLCLSPLMRSETTADISDSIAPSMAPVTSHSSQGQTADRVLVHVDTEQAGEKLVNRRLAYLAVSRGRYDAQLYTNDKTHLAEQLSRDVSHRSAIEPSRESAPSAQKIEPLSARSEVHGHTQAEGHSISRWTPDSLRSRRRQRSSPLRGSLRSPLTASTLRDSP